MSLPESAGLAFLPVPFLQSRLTKPSSSSRSWQNSSNAVADSRLNDNLCLGFGMVVAELELRPHRTESVSALQIEAAIRITRFRRNAFRQARKVRPRSGLPKVLCEPDH